MWASPIVDIEITMAMGNSKNPNGRIDIEKDRYSSSCG